MRADIDAAGVVNNVVDGCPGLPGSGCQCGGAHSDPLDGMTRVVLTDTPQKPVGENGWTFQQTGTHGSGYPEGTAVPEPISLALWVKQRVVELSRDKKALEAAAAAKPIFDYSDEIAAIDAEVDAL